MPKLSYEQIRLLTWLAIIGDTFGVRFVKSKNQFEYMGLHHYVTPDGIEFKFDTRTLKKLIRTNLIKSKVVWHYGIKWKCYEFTESGYVYSSLIAASKGFSWTHLKKSK